MALADFFVAIIAASGAPSMSSERAVEMRVTEDDQTVLVELLAATQTERSVEYDVEVIGASRSRHSGKSAIGPEQSSPLSRFRVSHRGEWCAVAQIREEGGESYTLEAGNCAGHGSDRDDH